MNITSLRGMFEATRLTRAGRLTEATALLQQMLQGRAVSGDAPPPAESTPRIIDIIDGVAETIGTADAAAPHAAPVRGIGVRRGGLGATAGASALPAMSALRSFLERDNRIGFPLPPGGLVFPDPAEKAPDAARGRKIPLSDVSAIRPAPVPTSFMCPAAIKGSRSR